MKLGWVNNYSKQQQQTFKDSEATNGIDWEYYNLFGLSQKELDYYQKKTKEKKITMKDIDILIDVEKQLTKGLWIKNRYPEYFSKQWGYLSILYHTELSNLMFLNEIKEKTRPLNNLIHIFQYD